MATTVDRVEEATDSSEPKPVLEVRDLVKNFPIRGGLISRSIAEVQAVSGVSFKLHEGKTLGTPLYISPELARGDETIDIRSDLYSLGATFYHLACGSPPFATTTSACWPPQPRSHRASSTFRSATPRVFPTSSGRPWNGAVVSNTSFVTGAPPTASMI